MLGEENHLLTDTRIPFFPAREMKKTEHTMKIHECQPKMEKKKAS